MYRRLRDLREDNDISQEKISKYLYCSQSSYSRIESGKQDIPSKMLIQLADLYDVSTDYLLNRTNHKKIIYTSLAI
ncbi:helix-turn-helix domain-containing protein [Streptococcus sp. E17BB]|uniref:helix-turn-helix domain-containing protein n=1 Tax=Streptococcus sp. E17BB TaxID=3278714 RepID=UPI00359DE6ED